MKKKYLRRIIICALFLLAAVITIFNIDIEPAKQPSQVSVVSSAAAEAKNLRAETEEDKKEETENEKDSVAEKEVDNKISTDETKPTQETKRFDKKDASNIPPKDETASLKPKQHFCTIEIRCDTVADTSKLENQAVAPYVPKNGVILKTAEIEFTPGESVFDILLRVTSEKNIHMEFRDDNLYSGKYIEGINFLYEMDGGPLSGWMYKVNGKFPNYGCAAYEVCDGDAIIWMYTCDLGVDVGDNSTW